MTESLERHERVLREFLAREPFCLHPDRDQIRIFQTAFAHDSFTEEHNKKALNPMESYERLEFLGDAVVEFLVCEAAYSDRSLNTEKDLTDYKISKVRNDSLGEILSNRISGLEDAVRVGKGHISEDGGKKLSSDMKADVFEALVAALYLTRGMDAARELVRLLLRPAAHPRAHDTC